MRKEFIRFLFAGGAAALVNWGSRFAFSRHAPYEVAVAGAYLLGMMTGFLLMRGWVFGAAHHPVRKQIATYALVNLLALLQTLLISSVLARWLLPQLGVVRHAYALAHAGGIVAPVFTSFVLHRRATFRAPVAPPLWSEASETSVASLPDAVPSAKSSDAGTRV
jgi:putative flippase GtrA